MNICINKDGKCFKLHYILLSFFFFFFFFLDCCSSRPIETSAISIALVVEQTVGLECEEYSPAPWASNYLGDYEVSQYHLPSLVRT